jgi:hypothetical protein
MDEITTQLVGIGINPVTEEVTVAASQFDNGSYHSCGYAVEFSFSSNPADSLRTYSCDSIGSHEVEFWVTDSRGKQSHLTGLFIHVIDGNDVYICPEVRLYIDGTFNDDDSDGFAEVGETVAVTYKVVNTGAVVVENVSIASVSLGFAPVLIPTIAVGGDSIINYTYTLTQDDIDEEALYISELVTAIADGNPISGKSKDPTPISVNDDLYDSGCPTCTVIALPADPNRVAQIEGRVATEDDMEVIETLITLENSEMADVVTDANGNYAFPAMSVGGSYAVNPHKDGDDLNGVTTLDVVMIQRHILGLNKLDSPFKLIASDINNDEKVSASDLVQLRKAILGVTSGFPDNSSWRFVDKTYEFYDTQDPFLGPIQEQYFISYFDDNMNVDFVGVKIGDVNGSVNPGFKKSNDDDNRYQKTVSLLFDDQTIVAGNSYMIPIYADDFSEVAGFQYSFDLSGLQFDGLQTEAIDLIVDNLGFSTNMDKINVSWNTTDLISVDEDAPLFTIVFVATKSGILSDMMTISNDRLSAEIYQTDDLNINGITLEKRNTITEKDEFMMYQNSPNPFKGMSEIEFNLPADGNVNFSLFDVTGKTLMNKNISGVKGENYLMINKNDINTTGVVYYKMTFNNQSLTRKMIIIE